MKKMLICFTAGALVIFGLSFAAFAEEDVNFGDKVPEMDSILNTFDPQEASPQAAPESDVPEGYKPRAIIPTAAAPTVEKPKAISMEIRFQKNSHELTRQAREVLDVVGKSFNTDRLRTMQFRIEGYTDASGPESYNLNLSQQRADSVKRYLVRKHDVDSSRLDIVGKGESNFIDPDPYAARNRRVRIVNVGN